MLPDGFSSLVGGSENLRLPPTELPPVRMAPSAGSCVILLFCLRQIAPAAGFRSAAAPPPPPPLIPNRGRPRRRAPLLRCSVASEPNPASPQERMLEWARGLPSPAHVSPSVQVTVRPPSEGGAGLFASDDVAEGDTLAVLPLGGGFRFDAAAAVGLLGAGGNGGGGGGPVRERLRELLDGGTAAGEAAALAGAVAHLHLSGTRGTLPPGIAGRVAEAVGPFLDGLPLLPPAGNGGRGLFPPPHPFPSHVLHWSDAQVSQLLGGTLALTKARFARALAGEVVGRVSGAFVREHCPGGTVGEVTAARDALVAACAAVQSRTFEGLGEDEDYAEDDAEGGARGGALLIPLLDLLNHAPRGLEGGSNARHAIDDDRNAAVLVADRAIARGEEVLISYGPREAWDWGTRYGFVPEDAGDGDCGGRSLTVALPLLPDMATRASDGMAIDLTAAAEEGRKAAAALREVVESLEEEDADDGDEAPSTVQLATLFLPEEGEAEGGGAGGAGAGLPLKQPCLVVTGRDAEDVAGGRAAPVFRAAAEIIRDLGLEMDGDGGEGVGVVDAMGYVLRMATDRIGRLEEGGERARVWAESAEGGGAEEHTAERLRLADAMRRAERGALERFVRELR